jgi:hypothetical protein
MYPSVSFRINYGSILSAFAVALLCLSGVRGSLAQSIQGTIIGTVQDKAGAVVPGATLTLENLDEGSIRTTTSNGGGDYQFLDTKAGHYSLVTTATGFEKWSTTGVPLGRTPAVTHRRGPGGGQCSTGGSCLGGHDQRD